MKRARKDASGVVRIDVATGKVEHLEEDMIADGRFFTLTHDVNIDKVGELTLTVKDSPAKNAKNRFQRRVRSRKVMPPKEAFYRIS